MASICSPWVARPSPPIPIGTVLSSLITELRVWRAEVQIRQRRALPRDANRQHSGPDLACGVRLTWGPSLAPQLERRNGITLPKVRTQPPFLPAHRRMLPTFPAPIGAGPASLGGFPAQVS